MIEDWTSKSQWICICRSRPIRIKQPLWILSILRQNIHIFGQKHSVWLLSTLLKAKYLAENDVKKALILSQRGSNLMHESRLTHPGVRRHFLVIYAEIPVGNYLAIVKPNASPGITWAWHVIMQIQIPRCMPLYGLAANRTSILQNYQTIIGHKVSTAYCLMNRKTHYVVIFIINDSIALIIKIVVISIPQI